MRLRSRAEWPQFRGRRARALDRAGLPLEWSETRNVVWKTPIRGRGWSSPVISNGRVWITTSVTDARGASLRALALDVESGRELVNVEVSGSRAPISRTRRTATHPRRPSSKAIVCMCTSAAKGPRRWTPCPAQPSGRRNFRMRRSTAPAALQRSTAICLFSAATATMRRGSSRSTSAPAT